MTAPETRSSPPLVLVTVGSDHHPFDRLIDWVDNWARRRPDSDVRVVVQYGTSTEPKECDGSPYMEHGDLADLMRSATVIVTQGGPSSIVETRRAGRIPIVVPRDPSHGEHVDGHQIDFCRRLAADDIVRTVDSAPDLGAMIDRALAAPHEFAVMDDDGARSRVMETARRFGELVHEVVAPAVRPRVLLMVGSGRSGSTLLERALAEVPGVCALGETVHLWERGARDHELCGCGVAFDRCEFWSGVGKQAFGGWSRLDIGDMVDIRHRVIRTRRIPELLTMGSRSGWRLQRTRTTHRLEALYRAAVDVSGAQLLVDSSKLPAYAALLARARIDLRCVFVVRDPRGVAYSWAKSVERPEIVGDRVLMPRYGPARTAATWSLFAAVSGALRLAGARMHVVRYEDLLEDPRATVTEVLDFAGIDVDDSHLEHIDGSRLLLHHAHTVAGNPMRFTTGQLDLEVDTAWQQQLSRRDRRVVESLTFGVRRALGYR